MTEFPNLRKRFLREHSGPHNWLAWAVNWELVESALPFVSGRLLDLGCGVGPYQTLLATRATRIVGVDWPQTRHVGNATHVYADVSSGVPFSDGIADTIAAFHVLEHLRDPAHFLSEVKRVLAPGGCLVATVPFMWGVHEAPHDYHRFTRHGLQAMLEGQGLQIEVLREGTGFWTMWVLKFNYRTQKGTRGWRRALWRPVWALGQWAAQRLDQRAPGADETAGYLAVARKPTA